MSEKRYRVTEKRPYIKFGQLVVEAGNLIPKKIEVDPILVEHGWVEED